MKFQIWSNAREAWWRPGGEGYTKNQDEAGWFGYRHSLDVLMSSAFGAEPGKPNLVLVDQNGLRFTIEFQRPENLKEEA